MTTWQDESNADRYRRLAGTLDRRVSAVAPDRWDDPSPCEGWTAREVLGHIIDSERAFMAKQGGLDLEGGPDAAIDPVAAWRQTRDAIQAVLDDPDLGDKEYEGMFGRTTLGDSVAKYYAFDLVIHGWDIAHATGTDERIPDEDLELIRFLADGMGDALRFPGVCGPAIEAPEGADDQTKLLAHLGRVAWR